MSWTGQRGICASNLDFLDGPKVGALTPKRQCGLEVQNTLPEGQGLDFTRLKKLTGATDGNLGAHIETLAKTGYVDVAKAFVGKRPQTTVTATAAGRGAFARHVATLREIITGAGE